MKGLLELLRGKAVSRYWFCFRCNIRTNPCPWNGWIRCRGCGGRVERLTERECEVPNE